MPTHWAGQGQPPLDLPVKWRALIELHLSVGPLRWGRGDAGVWGCGGGVGGWGYHREGGGGGGGGGHSTLPGAEHALILHDPVHD